MRTAKSATPPFAALATAPGLARGHVRATLAEWGLGELAEAAELIASEMTANAVNASAPVQAAGDVLVIRVCLLANGDVLAIECWDQAPGVPVLRAASGLEESGRGLAIIDSLTGGAWGCQPAIGQAGKCVWAEIPVRDVPASPLRASAVPNRAATRAPSEQEFSHVRRPHR
jgi:anti-sigma regulatory factor (Ser/Thr protein kinase)